MPSLPRRIGLLGCGLIGGSIARALTTRLPPGARPTISAWTRSGSGAQAARSAGVVDEVAPTVEGAVAGADLIVVAVPAAEALGLLDRVGEAVRASGAPPASGPVVTDVASTKALIGDRAASAGLRFVGGHPMAGAEAAGFGASSPDLFLDRPWVIVPPPAPDPEATAAVEWLATACGARPTTMSAGLHDRAVAAISHLPLVLSAALVEAMAEADAAGASTWNVARDLAAGGWASMTRLARGDARMGAGIAATNGPAMAAAARRFRAELDAWIDLLETPGGPDPDAAERRFRRAREILLDGDG